MPFIEKYVFFAIQPPIILSNFSYFLSLHPSIGHWSVDLLNSSPALFLPRLPSSGPPRAENRPLRNILVPPESAHTSSDIQPLFFLRPGSLSGACACHFYEHLWKVLGTL